MLTKSAKDNVKDFINNNPKTSFMLMDTLLKGGVIGGQLGYVKKVLPMLAREDAATYDALASLGLKKGLVEDILESTPTDPLLTSFKNPKAIIGKPITFGKSKSAFDEANAFFSPKGLTNAASKDSKFIANMLGKKPGILAHELGHAEDYLTGDYVKNYMRGSKLHSLGGLATTIAALAGANDNTLLAMGAGTSLLDAPVLRAEFAASKNGYKMLRQLGKGRLKALSAFVGIPTYVTTNLGVSFSPYLVRKLLNKLSKKSDN